MKLPRGARPDAQESLDLRTPALIRPDFGDRDPWDPHHPLVLTVTGAGGSAKHALAREIERRGLRRVISTTTRPPRPSEVPGVDYHFVNARAFAIELCGGAFAEVTRHAGHFFGVTRPEVDSAAASRSSMCMVLSPQGVRRMRLWAAEHGYRIRSIFLQQLRAAPVREHTRPVTAVWRQTEQGRPSSVLRAQAGWLAELCWDMVIYSTATSPSPSAIAHRILRIARSDRVPVTKPPSATQRPHPGALR